MPVCYRRVPAILSIAVLLLLYPFLAPPYYTQLATRALILSILAMGLNLATGYAGLPSLGHAAFFGMAAYTTAILAKHVSANIWLSLAASVSAATLLAAVFGLISLRTSKVYFLFITLALGQVVWAVVFGWRSVTGGDDGISGIGNPQLWPSVSISGNVGHYFLVLFFFLITCFLFYKMLKSPFGHSIVGIKENELRMKAMGYNVWLHKFIAFCLSGALSGLAGALWAFFNGFVSPVDSGFGQSAEALLMVILGGAGTLFGPVVGAFVIVAIRYVVSAYTSRWFLILGVVYMVTILCAPKGILKAIRR